MPPPDRRRLGSASMAIGTMFFVNGFAFGSWVPRLPEIREALDVGDATLGLVLLGAGIGGVTVSLLSGWIVDRAGSRLTMIATSVALSLLIPLIAVAPSPPVLFATLLAIGAIDGLTDVAQNTQAIELQGSIVRSILTRMHASWSIGTLLGGLVASWAAGAGVSFTTQLGITAAVLAGATLLAGRWLLPSVRRRGVIEGGALAGRRPPRRRLMLLFAIGVAAILAEMPPTEWSSLLMAERFDLDTGSAGLGFVAFSVGMVLGRVGGDLVVDRIGAERARRAGSVLGGLGILIVATSPSAPVAGLGLVIAGLGSSTLFPLAIRRASELTAGSSAGVAAFSSGARAGMLGGSPLMGLLSSASTRSTALLVIAGTAALVSAAIRLPQGTLPDG